MKQSTPIPSRGSDITLYQSGKNHIVVHAKTGLDHSFRYQPQSDCNSREGRKDHCNNERLYLSIFFDPVGCSVEQRHGRYPGGRETPEQLAAPTRDSNERCLEFD